MVFTVLTHGDRVMGSVVVLDDMYGCDRVTSRECLTNLGDKGLKVRGVRSLSQHEDWLRDKSADCPDDSDARITSLVQHDLDRLLVCYPGPIAVHPTIEAGLVDVNQHLLLLDERGELDRKLPPFLLFL